MRGGEKKNRHTDSPDKQLHRSLFGRQVGMSSGLLPGQKIEYSREDREENAQRENTGETTAGTTPGFILFLCACAAD